MNTIASLRCLMIFDRVNYGSLLHSSAPAIYVVPLTMQALPPVYVLLFILGNS